MRELTGGRLNESVQVALNRLLVEYDHVLICGPVFPHEVVGFSGGTKYLFPGVAAAEIIHFTHWLGALITSYDVIGTMDTPVRAVIDRAASLLRRRCRCWRWGDARRRRGAVLRRSARHLARGGDAVVAPACRLGRQAVSARAGDDAADVRRSVDRRKGMYKIEPAVADGGEVVIYAPHVTEVSYVHGKLLDEVGYHCRDYFVSQWERFKHYPGGILAHSTHVRGLGTFDASCGLETPRIQVTLATGIPRERCERINLGYMDPARLIRPSGADTGWLVVPRAGRMRSGGRRARVKCHVSRLDQRQARHRDRT